jgi:hypothetical protein
MAFVHGVIPQILPLVSFVCQLPITTSITKIDKKKTIIKYEYALHNLYIWSYMPHPPNASLVMK